MKLERAISQLEDLNHYYCKGCECFYPEEAMLIQDHNIKDENNYKACVACVEEFMEDNNFKEHWHEKTN